MKADNPISYKVYTTNGRVIGYVRAFTQRSAMHEAKRKFHAYIVTCVEPVKEIAK